jgi:hypothetical protein
LLIGWADPRLLHIAVDADSCSPARRDARSAGNREHAVVALGKELRVHKRGEDGVQGLGIETEQAPGLGRREPETGHLEVFRTDSAQQFCKRNVSFSLDARPRRASHQERIASEAPNDNGELLAPRVSVDFGGAGSVALASVAVSQQSPCPVDHAGHIDLRNLAPVGQHR